ncbi:MAG: hypothetical protein AUI04_05955 [Candidatus Rokubacteria bacterium 13_2_20CM_2_64_8]|nr:MAG: hypothetical protein AUI04_05955 [Candidatus Rokubacteria bacterium 13_2_20CM_2_64_8]
MPTTRRSRDTNGHTPTTNDTMRRVEAISVGAVNVLTGTVVSALRGMQEIGTEVGDVARIARDAADGALDAADRIGSATVRLVRGVVDEAVTRANVGSRKSLNKADAAPIARASRSRRRVA